MKTNLSNFPKTLIFFSILLFFSLCLPNTAYGWTVTKDQCDLDHCGSPLDIRTYWGGKICTNDPPDNLHTVCCYERIRDPETDWGFSSSKWCAPSGVVNSETCNQDQCVKISLENFECSIPGCVPDVDVTGIVNVCRGCIPEVLSPTAPTSTTSITLLKPTTCKSGFTALEAIDPSQPGLGYKDDGILTALGCFPTRPRGILAWILKYGAIFGGGSSFITMAIAALQMILSTGNPEKLKKARELLIAAISGLMIIIFSVFFLKLIGFTILKIPGWG